MRLQSSVKGPGVQGGVFPKLSAGYYTPARPELGLVFSGSLRGQDGNRGQPILTASCAPVARRSPPGQCPSEERAREQMRKKENGLQVSERNSTQRELSRVFSPTLFSPSLLQGPGQTRLTYFREGGRWRAGRERQALSLPGPVPNPVMVLRPRRDPRGPPGGGEAGRPLTPGRHRLEHGGRRLALSAPLRRALSWPQSAPGQRAGRHQRPRCQGHSVCEKRAQPSRLEQPSRTGAPASVSRSQKQTELGGQSKDRP